MSVQSKVAGTILQEQLIVKIGGVNYEVTPPSTAVLVKVSEIISGVPAKKLNQEDVLGEVLRNAKDWSFVSRLIAQMILGVKNPKKRLSILKEKDEVEQLAKVILLAPPSDLKSAIEQLFKHHEVGSFFGLTAFLLEVGITNPTREAETTVPGH